MKIVLDSNVLIAAFATRGLCDVILEHSIKNHEVAISDFILKEVKNNLEKKFKTPKQIILEIEVFLKLNCKNYNPPELEKKVCRDQDDDNILSLATHSNSDLIISGDKDLLTIKSYQNISIITPRQFADLIRK